ncbi:MAG: hypothetical protein LBQ66_15635 [Planctomycetaceae bacterium]|nr:hypothetical protein [Planctomycetaceae bacterium]
MITIFVIISFAFFVCVQKLPAQESPAQQKIDTPNSQSQEISSLQPNGSQLPNGSQFNKSLVGNIEVAPQNMVMNKGEIKYYLLRTNYIIEGKAKFDGKTYDIKTSNVSVKVPAQNVEFIGNSRNDIYQYRKTQFNPTDSIELIRFAQWCVSNNFLHEAIVEYENAGMVAADNITADVIKDGIIAVKKKLANTIDKKPTGINSANNDKIINATANLDTAKLNTAKSDTIQIKTAKNLADQFALHVQPIIVKNCAMSNCHGIDNAKQNGIFGGTKKFRFICGQLPNAKNTQYNLNECISHIDMSYPMRSRLLSMLVVPHSGYAPPFNVESNEYHKLIDWIQLAAKNLPLIKNSELAPLFSNQNKTSPYVTANLNLDTSKIETASTQPAPIPTTSPQPKNTNLPDNLPAGFQEIINIQKISHNTNQNNKTTTQPINTQPNSKEKICTIPNCTETNHADCQIVDNTDPKIFNAKFHPKKNLN